jgi:hypothetical protein
MSVLLFYVNLSGRVGLEHMQHFPFMYVLPKCQSVGCWTQSRRFSTPTFSDRVTLSAQHFSFTCAVVRRQDRRAATPVFRITQLGPTFFSLMCDGNEIHRARRAAAPFEHLGRITGTQQITRRQTRHVAISLQHFGSRNLRACATFSL